MDILIWKKSDDIVSLVWYGRIDSVKAQNADAFNREFSQKILTDQRKVMLDEALAFGALTKIVRKS